MKFCTLFLALLAGLTSGARAEAGRRGLDGLTPIPLAKLSRPPEAALELTALGLSPSDWKHAETEHFIYHFFHTDVATPVAVEAEFYRRIFRESLGLDETGGPAEKVHVYLFERPELWQAFQTGAALDPWSGGIHSGSAIFLLRDRGMKFKGGTLSHEIMHALLASHVGAVPLWLNEGYAEYASNIGYTSYLRARQYAARPRTPRVEPSRYIPLASLVRAKTYPADEEDVAAFYTESQRLVGFLQRQDASRFPDFLRLMASGTEFESALSKIYGAMFNSPRELEAKFRPYATASE